MLDEFWKEYQEDENSNELVDNPDIEQFLITEH